MKFEKNIIDIEPTADSKNIAIITWLGTLFFSVVPALIIYLLKQDDDFVKAQSKEALNWCITSFLFTCLAYLLSLILIGFLLFPVIGLCHLIVCIIGAVKCAEGKEFSVPFNIRLLK